MNPSSMDFGNFNFVGFGLAVLFNILLGFVWYAKFSPTGRTWMRAQGLDPERLPPPGNLALPMALMLLGAAAMMFVFAHTNAVYLDAYRNTASGGTAGYHLTALDGAMAGVFTTLGFVVPLGLNRVAFERAKWSLFWVNTGYYLVALVVAGILIATVGAK